MRKQRLAFTNLYKFLALISITSAAIAYNPFLDPVFQAIYNTPECPKSEAPSNPAPEAEGYDGHDYSAEPQHYSWDNLYLEPQIPEIIVDPYKEDVSE